MKRWICISPLAGAYLANALAKEAHRIKWSRLALLLAPSDRLRHEREEAHTLNARAYSLVESLAGTPYILAAKTAYQATSEACARIGRIARKRGLK